jgi:hypothetical protein
LLTSGAKLDVAHIVGGRFFKDAVISDFKLPAKSQLLRLPKADQV